MIRQRRDTMTDAEISILALEIIKDFQSLSTKTNIDPNDSFLSNLDTDDDINDLLSDTVIEQHSQNSDTYPPTNKYNILPLQPTDSLHDIPPIPDTTNPFASKFKPTNLSIHVPQIHYHYSGNKKRVTKMKKLKINPIENNNMNNIPMPMDTTISPSISVNSTSKSRSITGYSPYNSSMCTNSTAISISPNRSPVYSNNKFIETNIPTRIDITSLSPNQNIQYSKEYKKRNKKLKKNKNKKKIRYHKTPVPKSNRNKNIKFERTRKYRSDELGKIAANYYEYSTENVMNEFNIKRNKKLKNKNKKNKNKIGYNKTPVPKSKKKKNVKFDRSRKHRSDELGKISRNYYKHSTKSLMNEFNLNIHNKLNGKRYSAQTATFENNYNNIRFIQSNQIKSFSNKEINTLSMEHISPKQPLPFFVKRGAVSNPLQLYGKSVPVNDTMENEMDNIKRYSLESDQTDCTLNSNSSMFQAQNIRYLYNNGSNNVKKSTKKRRKNKKSKRNKKKDKLNVRNVNERRSATPVPTSKNNINIKKHKKYRSNSIEMNNNNEYMIEFEDGFIFVNE